MDIQSNAMLENFQRTSKLGLSDLPRIGILSDDKIIESGIPKRNLSVKIIGNNEWGSDLKQLKSQLRTGALSAIIGKRGTGKTQMAVMLVREALHRQISARYVLTMDFFIAVKATYDTNSKLGEGKIINKFLAPRLLVLDEIHERSSTDWENRLLTHLVNKRYAAMKDTILISNQTLDVFQREVGSSIMSRLQETGVIIECRWDSFRNKSTPNTQDQTRRVAP